MMCLVVGGQSSLSDVVLRIVICIASCSVIWQ